MDRRAFLAAAGSAFAGATAGCVDVGLGDGGLADDDYDVGMSANAFVPERIEVSVGDEVVWGNNGTRGHTVTAYEAGLPDGATFFASGDFESTDAAREAWSGGREGNIAPGETFAHTFETPGEHRYFCIPHERKGMAGVVVVTE